MLQQRHLRRFDFGFNTGGLQGVYRGYTGGKPPTSHLLERKLRPTSHPHATPKPLQSLLIGNRLRLQSHPKARRKSRSCAGNGKQEMPKSVSVCRFSRRLRTFPAWCPIREAVGTVPAWRSTALAGGFWGAEGQPTKQKGRPAIGPPPRNPQPIIPQTVQV
jgi:hypothetical protein